MFKPGNAQPSGDPGVLVVRLGAMGDVIHALPAVASLKHSLPGRPVSWVVDPLWACLLKDNPFVDRVVPLDRKSLAGIKQAWRELRARRYALAVDFQGLCKSALTASCVRSEDIYGFHQSQAREPIAALFYSKRVRTKAAHVVDRNLELAAAAGASSVLYTFPLPAGREDGELPAGEFVLASPFAGWAGKQWPLEYYTLLAQLLERDLGLPLVLSGPRRDADGLAQVAGTLAHVSSIPGLIHATRRATAVLGIDSGPLHLAAALDKPGVAVFGPTDPARNGPYGKSFTVLRAPGAATTYKRKQEIDSSMREISPDAVLTALKERLAGRSRGAVVPS
jgi:heptosyltransferase-1